MTRFQLIFRQTTGDRAELHDTTNGHAMINGQLLVDGTVFEIKGVEWLASLDDSDYGDDLIHFNCTLAVAPTDE